jgi:hypothetical protein
MSETVSPSANRAYGLARVYRVAGRRLDDLSPTQPAGRPPGTPVRTGRRGGGEAK